MSADKPLIINTDEFFAASGTDIWENREKAYKMYGAPGVPKCSIAVLAYNRLDKTKYCVECILKYTADVDYELLLIDNGSNDGTSEYFDKVEYENKKIIRITKNIGSGFAWRMAREAFSGKYLVLISNDVYVTSSWLSNLLKCYESDARIGFVGPVSSNVSNFQQVDLTYRSYDEMQAKAAVYNVSDPSKWEERMRLISLIGIYSRPVLDAVGLNDAAFIHNFTEDDFALRLRRAGYKLMLCRDTWVCHDHEYVFSDEEAKSAFLRSIDTGRAIFKEKYHGLDAWEDVLDFERGLLMPLETHAFAPDKLSCLVVDGRCGSPVLELKNILKRRGSKSFDVHAFTTEAKYFADLESVAKSAKCDRIEFIHAHYDTAAFDIIALAKPINFYADPLLALKNLYTLVKPHGILLFKLYNCGNYEAFSRLAGLNYSGGGMSVMLPREAAAMLENIGATAIDVIPEWDTPEKAPADEEVILNAIRAINPGAGKREADMLKVRNYIFKVIKG